MTITKTEARQRLRRVRAGDWNDALIYFEGDPTPHYSKTCEVIATEPEVDVRTALIGIRNFQGLRVAKIGKVTRVAR